MSKDILDHVRSQREYKFDDWDIDLEFSEGYLDSRILELINQGVDVLRNLDFKEELEYFGKRMFRKGEFLYEPNVGRIGVITEFGRDINDVLFLVRLDARYKNNGHLEEQTWYENNYNLYDLLYP